MTTYWNVKEGTHVTNFYSTLSGEKMQDDDKDYNELEEEEEENDENGKEIED